MTAKNVLLVKVIKRYLYYRNIIRIIHIFIMVKKWNRT